MTSGVTYTTKEGKIIKAEGKKVEESDYKLKRPHSQISSYGGVRKIKFVE